MDIDPKLEKSIVEYCKLNELDTNEYVTGLLKKAFNVDRYGDKPNVLIKQEKKDIEPVKPKRGRKPKQEVIVVPEIKEQENSNESEVKNVSLEPTEIEVKKDEPKRRNRRKLS